MKEKHNFFCTHCRKTLAKWSGYCHYCTEQNTIVEQKVAVISSSGVVPLEQIMVNEKETRFLSGVEEWDRVFGNGVVRGSSLLLSGMPGIGKSTLLLGIIDRFAQEHRVLYLSSEEPLAQIKSRADRIGITQSHNVFLAAASELSSIMATIESVRPPIVVIDSLQNIAHEEAFLTNSISLVRHVAHVITEHGRKHNYLLIITGHVTKDGAVAGPKSLEHIVDVVAYVEGEEEGNVRLLRVTKNRFGGTEETGIFLMTAAGVIPCSHPQSLLIENKKPTVGSALTWQKTGSRFFFIEVQTLVQRTKSQFPQRVITGVDQKQLMLIIAVLEKYLKIVFREYDIFCKTGGNFKLKNTESDVAIAVGLLSSYFNIPNSMQVLFSGEIGLSGNITTSGTLPPKAVGESYGITEFGSGFSSVYSLMTIFKKHT